MNAWNRILSAGLSFPKNRRFKDDTREFVNRVFDGSVPLLFSSLLSQKALSKKELEELKQMINEME